MRKISVDIYADGSIEIDRDGFVNGKCNVESDEIDQLLKGMGITMESKKTTMKNDRGRAKKVLVRG